MATFETLTGGYTLPGGDDSQVTIGVIHGGSVTGSSANDTVNVTNYIQEDSEKHPDISLGDGGDILTVGQHISYATIDLGAGNNTLSTGQQVSGSSVTMGDGNDSVSIGTYIQKSTINLGGGSNFLSVGSVGDNHGLYGSVIEAGDGADTIHIVGQVSASYV